MLVILEFDQEKVKEGSTGETDETKLGEANAEAGCSLSISTRKMGQGIYF